MGEWTSFICLLALCCISGVARSWAFTCGTTHISPLIFKLYIIYNFTTASIFSLLVFSVCRRPLVCVVCFFITLLFLKTLLRKNGAPELPLHPSCLSFVIQILHVVNDRKCNIFLEKRTSENGKVSCCCRGVVDVVVVGGESLAAIHSIMENFDPPRNRYIASPKIYFSRFLITLLQRFNCFISISVGWLLNSPPHLLRHLFFKIFYSMSDQPEWNPSNCIGEKTFPFSSVQVINESYNNLCAIYSIDLECYTLH